MNIIDVTLSYERLEEMLPTDDDGNVTSITEVAWEEAWKALGLEHGSADVCWHTPAVFDVRYGSSYAAAAMTDTMKVRFHHPEGDFREGDDKM